MAGVSAYTDSHGRVSMRNPGTGEYVWIPSTNAQAAADAGFEPEDRTAYTRRQQAAEFDSPVKAGLAGLARGATLGLSDVVLTETGIASPEDLSQLKEYNPIASTVGDVAGTAASALLPGGPLGLAGKAGARAGAAVAARAGTGLAGRAAGAAARAVAPAVTEGAVLGAGQAVSEAALSGRTDDIVGKLARRSLEGAALGGAFGLGFLGIGQTIKGAVGAGRKALTAGRKPSEIAMAARRQMEGGADVLGHTGAERLIAAEKELGDATSIMRELTRQQRHGGIDHSSTLAQLRGRQKTLRQEVNTLHKELSGRIRQPTQTIKTTTKTTTEPGARVTAQPTRAQKVADDAVVPQLTEAEKTALLRQEHGTVLANYNNILTANEVHRNNIRRLIKLGDDRATSAVWESQAQYLDEGQRILLKRLNRLRSELGKRGEQIRQTEGSMLIGAGLVPAEQRAARATVEPVTKKTVTETVTKRGVDPKAQADALLARESALASRPQLDDELLKGLAGLQTPGVLEKFLDWRSAGTLFGWIVGGPMGAVLGGPLGGSRFVREAALEPALAAIAGVAGNAARTVSGKTLPAGALPTLALKAADVAGLTEELRSPLNEPSEIYRQSLAGYKAAGMEQGHAVSLARFQAERANMLRDYAPDDPQDEQQRESFGRALDAMANPRRIGERLKSKQATDEDVDAFQRLFPDQAAATARVAEKVLDDPETDLDPQAQETLEKLAGRQDYTFARLQTVQDIFNAGQQGEQTRMARSGSTRGAARAASTMQRIKMNP